MDSKFHYSKMTTFYGQILLFALFGVFLWPSCKKEYAWNLEKVIPRVETNKVLNVKANSVRVEGRVLHNGGLEIKRSGFCVGENAENLTVDAAKVYDVAISGKNPRESGDLKSNLEGLKENTVYYARAFATNEKGTAYGEIKSFTTTRLAAIITGGVSNIGPGNATCIGVVINDWGYGISDRGICWDTDSLPDLNTGTAMTSGNGTGAFECRLTKLPAATKIFYRAFAINDCGIAYGQTESFRTLDAAFASVITKTATNASYRSATCNGEVLDDGGALVTSRGFCYSKSPNPDLSNASLSSGSGLGTFSADLTGLDPSTTYYVRAFAENSKGINYGNQVTIRTLTITPPSVATGSVSSRGYTQFTAGGNVTDDGGSTVTARGICWSTSTQPTLGNSYTNDGSGTGAFSSTANGLAQGTVYYYRAYAVNSAGTAYGAQFSVSTNYATVPSITTVSPNSINPTYAYSGGNNISDGGSTITAKGVCWNTTGSPTIANSKTSSGSGTATFSSYMSGLSPGTTYYVRAYATNAMGTAYGNTYAFTTPTTASLSPPQDLYLDYTPGNNYLKLLWDCVQGATSYELQISTSSTFSGGIYNLPYYPGYKFRTNGEVMQGSITSNCVSNYQYTNSLTRDHDGFKGTSKTFYLRVRSYNSSSKIYSQWSITKNYTFSN
jgi:hypothetical protein